MNILYIAHRIPYPPDKGDKLRAFRQLAFLARTHHVSCACFVDDPDDLRHVAVLEALCERVAAIPLQRTRATVRGLLGWLGGSTLTESYYRVSAMAAVLREWSNETTFDAVVAFSSSVARYALAIPARRRVLDLCDLDSRKWVDYGVASGPALRLFYRSEGARLARREQAWIEAFDATLLITEAEARALGTARFARSVHVVGNGVALPELDNADGTNTPCDAAQSTTAHPSPKRQRGVYAAVGGSPRTITDQVMRESLRAPIFPGKAVACAPGSDRPTVGFIGTMDYRPNVDAVRWFVENCWSGIRTVCPDAVFRIVGRSPTRAVRRLAATPGVEVTGAVADAVAEVRRFQVSVAPLRIARGLQNKVLEAMSLARPVVLTSRAAEGIAARDGREFLIADTSKAMIEHVAHLLHTPAARLRLGESARAFVARHHCWEDQLRAFEGIVTGTLSDRVVPNRSTGTDLVQKCNRLDVAAEPVRASFGLELGADAGTTGCAIDPRPVRT